MCLPHTQVLKCRKELLGTVQPEPTKAKPALPQRRVNSPGSPASHCSEKGNLSRQKGMAAVTQGGHKGQVAGSSDHRHVSHFEQLNSAENQVPAWAFPLNTRKRGLCSCRRSLSLPPSGTRAQGSPCTGARCTRELSDLGPLLETSSCTGWDPSTQRSGSR